MGKILINTLLIIFITSYATSICQNDWKLKEEKDGIKVYSRASEYSNFDEFKGITNINASLHTFVSVLQDIEALPDWMHSVKYGYILETEGDSVQVYYTESTVPFPFQNRDGVYRNQFKWIADSNMLAVDILVLQGYVEEKSKIVRIKKGSGKWTAEVMGADTLQITFQMLVDPGGNIPSWMANMFIVDTPFKTLWNLKEIIKKEKYQNQQFDFPE
ncbi:MAG: hypothetical protein K8R53_10570 [Bacteroidales bacterium]|nr:hypothetical protein [Bacteroidales bacterium]